MRKILCIKQEKKESEKRGVLEKIKNIIKVLFCDPEDVSRKTDDPLSAFEKTDTYKSMSAEFKFQLKSLMGYEYESKEEAEEGVMQLLRCFESQEESNLEIKVSAKEGYTVFISDNRKNRKIPNTYTGELNFEISEKLSITSLHILSFILSFLLVGPLLKFSKIKTGYSDISFVYAIMLYGIFASIRIVFYLKFKKMRKITTFMTYLLLVKAIMLFVLLFNLTKETNFGFFIICMIAFFFVLLISDSSFDGIKRWLSTIIGIIPVGAFLEMLINKKG